MCLINSSLGSTVQLFLSLSRKCLHRVTANQGNVCGKNQADCLWMISRELNMLWKVIIITSIIFYIKLYTLIITMMELKQVFCIKKQLINTKSWAYLQFCQWSQSLKQTIVKMLQRKQEENEMNKFKWISRSGESLSFQSSDIKNHLKPTKHCK